MARTKASPPRRRLPRVGHRLGLPHGPGLVPQPAPRPGGRGPAEGRAFRFSARELTGDECEQVWKEVVLAHLPSVERYARRAGRRIPVALLTPEKSAAGGGPGPVGR